MEKNKKIKIIINIVITLMLMFAFYLIMGTHTNAAYVTTKFATNSGKVVANTKNRHTLNVPVDSKVDMYFTGGTYGHFEVSLVDENGKEVCNVPDEYYSSYSNNDELVFSKKLKAGKYIVKIINTSSYSNYSYKYYANLTPTVAVPTKSLTLSKSSLKLVAGLGYKLTYSYSPQYATNDIKFISSNTKVAKVDSNGKITAVANGTATITAQMGNVKKTCSVTVKAGKSATTIYSKKGELASGTKKTFSFNVPTESAVEIEFVGYEGTDANTHGDYKLGFYNGVQYTKSGNTSYDNVKMKIPFIFNKGTYKFYIQANGYSDFDYYMKVNIRPTSTVAVSSVKLNTTSKTMSIGDSITLKATSTPAYATSKVVTWTSSNKNVASVDKNGVVTAKTMGTTTITAKIGGKTAKCTIKVNKLTLNIWRNQSLNLQGYVKNISKYKNGKWSTSRKTVATVSNGKISTKNSGDTSVTFTVGNNKYTFKVYVYDKGSAKDMVINRLKARLKNPSSLIINDVHYYSTGNYNTVNISIDYNAMNGFGGYNRDRAYGVCENGMVYFYF